MVQELRLQGNWLMVVPRVGWKAEIRFISGGHQIISSLTFSDSPGTVVLKACKLDFVDHLQGFILRTPDWGWHFQFSVDIGHFISIDRYTPFVEKPDIHMLSCSLKDIPVNGLYSLC